MYVHNKPADAQTKKKIRKEKLLTDDDKLCRHEKAEEVEDELECRPLGCPHQPPTSRREDEGVPCSYGEGADEEIFVRAQVGGQVE